MQRTTLDREQLFDAYEELGSLSAVAKLHGVSFDTIKRYFDKFDLKYHSKHRKFNCDHYFFSRDTEESFYWAGFLAANGNIATETAGRQSYRVSLCVALKDKDHLQKFKHHISSEAPVKELVINKDSNPYTTARFLVSSKIMVNDLADRFFVVPRKSFIYTIPNWVQKHALVRHFLRGWVDGKGSFFAKDGKLQYFRTSGTLSFLRSFKSILMRECRAKERHSSFYGSSQKSSQIIGTLTYLNEDQILQISHYLYDDAKVYLNRKRNAALKITNEELQTDEESVLVDFEQS